MSAGYMKKHFDSQGKPKQSFASRKAAESFRTSMITAGRWRAEATNTYHCNWCGNYHAGRLGRVSRGGGRTPRKAAPTWFPTQ